jgi:hypothetical protein
MVLENVHHRMREQRAITSDLLNLAAPHTHLNPRLQ